MKYMIVEKKHVWVVFVEVGEMHILCQIGDTIEKACPESVSEIRFSKKARQGLLFLKKDILSRESIQRMIGDSLNCLRHEQNETNDCY
jgi:hypothetical protein